jgi:hypothetical protein
MQDTVEPTVYFAGAIRGDRTLGPLMKEMVRFIKEELEIPVLSEHVAEDNPQEAFAKKIGKPVSDITDRDVEKQDIAWIQASTHVIAEISGASTGAGREIEYARLKHLDGEIPAKVLCLYRADLQANVSRMITGMTHSYHNVFVCGYANIEDAKSIIRLFLRS